MTLRDALAVALHLVMVRRVGVEFCHHGEDADAILSDPAFRAALTASIAEALCAEYGDTFGRASWEDEAAAIVARMLDPGK